ncbi:uncharacterized protein CANTADRAFT_338627 [Suhomyces tanzawaensis NRRL Y-17324]|uniref:Uncharacterized protein n=1 Tax=Suhomyces tanzawaensis NRRL Y-17324 TaxID=984487 RepID=A0A1E4SPP8_9ASCO|nr:uncharacterized protein CANTADRAFT_338627 [Suhomyces tanzawaensis NRRL Y-17324]ODV81483.1 hypothetical protein CANTADRAFT_338627 [Suhomyces tanzawaensis NRRL Y-17324]
MKHQSQESPHSQSSYSEQIFPPEEMSNRVSTVGGNRQEQENNPVCVDENAFLLPLYRTATDNFTNSSNDSTSTILRSFASTSSLTRVQLIFLWCFLSIGGSTMLYLTGNIRYIGAYLKLIFCSLASTDLAFCDLVVRRSW